MSKPQIKITANELLQIIDCYNSGFTIKEISNDYKISEFTLRNIIRGYQGNVTTLNKLNPELKQIVYFNSPFYNQKKCEINESICIEYLKNKGYKILKPITDFKEI